MLRFGAGAQRPLPLLAILVAPYQSSRYLGNAQCLIRIYKNMGPTSLSDSTQEMSVRPFVRMQWVLCTLFVVTVVLLVWNHYGMERVVELSARTGVPHEAADDRVQNGGSVATLTQRDDVLQLRCALTKKSTWPYCKYVFFMGEGTVGMDLSQFDTVSYDVRHAGPGKRSSLRLLIMNADSGLTSADDWMSQRVNEVEFDVPPTGQVRVPVRVFRTASWWIDLRKVPLERTDVNIDNVVRVELMTGSSAEPGVHNIELRAIRFHGKWISQTHLLLILVAAWIACAVAWPVLHSVQLRKQLNSSRKRLALLSEINRALQLETKELVGQAHTDPLTGALNRQGLRAALMSTSTLLADPMAVIFVDLDHFKRINDEHGHETGDVVLRTFATTVSSEIRSIDKLVRWGGEEFVIICPATTAEQAYRLAQKLRGSMQNLSWPDKLHVTASFGVAEHQEREEIGAVIRRADEALYKAKANGRNRVEVSEADLNRLAPVKMVSGG
jgi:diguanylate cyclase (GGDEF)-like protein